MSTLALINMAFCFLHSLVYILGITWKPMPLHPSIWKKYSCTLQKNIWVIAFIYIHSLLLLLSPSKVVNGVTALFRDISPITGLDHTLGIPW